MRTLGYLYWLGVLPRGSGYYGLEPQTVTPAVADAIQMISASAADPDPLISRTVAEALNHPTWQRGPKITLFLGCGLALRSLDLLGRSLPI